MMLGRVLHLPIAELRPGHGTNKTSRGTRKRVRVRSSEPTSQLVTKRCVPCEADGRALGYMGLCDAMTKAQAEDYLQELDSWNLAEDGEGQLLISREWRAKSFVKALELCDRIAEVAEEEGHHPDLHVTGWNRLRVDLTTHARDGLTENDFIVAAKIDAIPKEDLLRKRRKTLPDA